MILVDTCGWIEWLTNGVLSDQYESYFNQVDTMIVSTSIQFELYKWVARKQGIQQALEAIALTEQTQVIPYPHPSSFPPPIFQRNINSLLLIQLFMPPLNFIQQNLLHPMATSKACPKSTILKNNVRRLSENREPTAEKRILAHFSDQSDEIHPYISPL